MKRPSERSPARNCLTSIPRDMEGDGQRATIVTAQGELEKLQGRGRDMLDAIAGSQNPTSSAQKVGAASCHMLCIALHCKGGMSPCNAALLMLYRRLGGLHCMDNQRSATKTLMFT